MITYKATLEVKGYHQSKGIDYDETFSPLVMVKYKKILFAIVAHYDNIWKMDANMTFRKGNLSKDV